VPSVHPKRPIATAHLPRGHLGNTHQDRRVASCIYIEKIVQVRNLRILLDMKEFIVLLNFTLLTQIYSVEIVSYKSAIVFEAAKEMGQREISSRAN
jgi:hypothetical protein